MPNLGPDNAADVEPECKFILTIKDVSFGSALPLTNQEAGSFTVLWY
jgi:hypothetical protein